MNITQAIAQLTNDNLKTTTLTLVALDTLQASFYSKRFEGILRKENPHSESEALAAGHALVENWTSGALLANGGGISAFSSSFVNAFLVMKMDSEAGIVMNFISESKTD